MVVSMPLAARVAMGQDEKADFDFRDRVVRDPDPARGVAHDAVGLGFDG